LFNAQTRPMAYDVMTVITRCFTVLSKLQKESYVTSLSYVDEKLPICVVIYYK
jgi:hypothetical protein